MRALIVLAVPVGYLALVVVQFLAIVAGAEGWLEVHWFIAAFIALFLAPIPILGGLVGMVGAVEVWGWSWPLAIGLFFGPYLVFAGLIAVAGGIGVFMLRRLGRRTIHVRHHRRWPPDRD